MEEESIFNQQEKTEFNYESSNDLMKSTSKLELEKSEKEGSHLKNIQVKKPRNVSNKTRPNHLRKFHEERLSRLEQYEIEEVDDSILIKSENNAYKLNKPFVEKPFDGDNHQICIYYPESMGGGRKMLFRKVKNTSSKYEEN